MVIRDIKTQTKFKIKFELFKESTVRRNNSVNSELDNAARHFKQYYNFLNRGGRGSNPDLSMWDS